MFKCNAFIKWCFAAISAKCIGSIDRWIIISDAPTPNLFKFPVRTPILYFQYWPTLSTDLTLPIRSTDQILPIPDTDQISSLNYVKFWIFQDPTSSLTQALEIQRKQDSNPGPAIGSQESYHWATMLNFTLYTILAWNDGMGS